MHRLVLVLALGAVGCASVVTTDGSATLDAAVETTVAGADGSDGGTSPGPTATTIADAATDATAPATDPLPPDRVAASFATFVADWDRLNATLHADDPGIDRIELHQGDFVHGEGLVGERTFAGQVTETAIIGGTTDEDSGAVRTVVVAVDPDGATAVPAVTTTFGITAAPGEPVADLVAAYDSIADGDVGGEAYVVSGANGFVIQKVDGAEADDPLVVVTVAPASDHDLAREQAATAQVAVFKALLEG